MSASAKITLLDGGMGHLLRRFGVPITGQVGSQERFLGVCLANIDQPELVINAHRDYLEAGSNVITTNTYSCVPNCVKLRTTHKSPMETLEFDDGTEGMPKRMKSEASMSTSCSEKDNGSSQAFGLECNCEGSKFPPSSRDVNVKDDQFVFLEQCINCAAVHAHSATEDFMQKKRKAGGSPEEPVIAGCIPPLGPSYKAFQAPSDDVMRRDYEYISAKIAPHCNLFLCETMASAREAVAAARVVRDKVTDEKPKPIWISFNLVESEDGKSRLPSGELLEDACDAVFDVFSSSIDDKPRNFLGAILINCCAPGLVLKAMPVLKLAIEAQERLGDVRFGGYPNAFVDMNDSYDRALTPERYADVVKEMIALGATIVGGCCGVFPEHIRAASEMLGKS